MSDHDRIYDLGYWTDRLTDAVHDSRRRIEETGKTTDKERLEAIADVLVDFTSCFGPEGVECYKNGRGLVIPGYFRPTKEWDLAVYSQKRLLAVIELKSMMSSVAKNLNNRTEEALGSAYDLRTAGRYGSFSGTNQPYTGYLMVLRDEESVRDVIKFQKAKLPLYDKVRDEFIGINTRDRLPLLFSKMISEKLYDKEYQRNVLAPKERGNVLQMFEDKPLDNDAWDIDIYYQQKMREVTDLKKWEIKEQGPLRLVIGLEWKYMNSTIEQEMILYSTNRRIDFSTHVDYRERQQLLKAAFPVDIRTTYATYDIQYGNVRRPNHWNTSWDQARFESVGHRFADLSERNYGVALLNDCKYGYDVKDNLLRISLLRSGKQPDHMQDIGEHVFTYSLLPHGGDFVEGGVVHQPLN